MTHRLLFISNLFPTVAEPYRGLDNATLLHTLASQFEIRVLSPRPLLPWARPSFAPRPCDLPFNPRWVRSSYIPKLGGAVNHRFMAASLRRDFEQTLRDFRPSVILSSWIFPDSIAALRLARGRLPVASIAQGSDVHQYLAMSARRRVILGHLPRAAAIITRSADLAGILKRASLPAAKLHTIYNGVDLATFQPRDQAAARLNATLPSTGPILLFVGNFYAVKNPFLAILALGLLTDGPLASSTPPTLVMAGGGPLEQPCRDLASSLHLSERVIFAGRKSPAEIAGLMNAADLLVLPSRNEGVPNVILESFASALPVVASRVGGIPEVLDQPTLGSTFPSGDARALAAAIARQLATPRDSAAIRAHALRFSWDAAASQYRDLLVSAIR